MQLGVEPLQAIEIDVGQPFRGQRLVLDPSRKLGHRGVGDGVVARRHAGAGGGAADESRGLLFLALEGDDADLRRIPERGGCEALFERDLARTDAELIIGRHLHAPVDGCLFAVCGRHLHLHQLFRFGEGSGRDFGTDRGRGSESGRSARRRLLAGRSLRRGGFESRAEHSQRAVGDEFPARSRHWVVPFRASRFPQANAQLMSCRLRHGSSRARSRPRHVFGHFNARPLPAAHAPQDSA